MEAVNDQVITIWTIGMLPIALPHLVQCDSRSFQLLRSHALTIVFFKTSKTDAVSWSPNPIANASA
jgi:hypothetical protein